MAANRLIGPLGRCQVNFLGPRLVPVPHQVENIKISFEADPAAWPLFNGVAQRLGIDGGFLRLFRPDGDRNGVFLHVPRAT